MSVWECPECGGGFPSPVEEAGGLLCPWCSRGLRHEWEASEVVRVTSAKRTENEEKGFMGLFK